VREFVGSHRPPPVFRGVFRGRRPGPATVEAARFGVEVRSVSLGAPIEGTQSCDEIAEGVEIGVEGGHGPASRSCVVAVSSPAR